MENSDRHDNGTCVHPAGEACPTTQPTANETAAFTRPSTLTVHDLALIRQAVLTVIDDGDPRTPRDTKSGKPMWCKDWQLYRPNEDEANDQRLRFAAAIERYIIERVK